VLHLAGMALNGTRGQRVTLYLSVFISGEENLDETLNSS